MEACSEVVGIFVNCVIDLAVSADDLLLQFVDVPSFAFKLVQLIELLSLLLVQVIQVWVHGASQTCA